MRRLLGPGLVVGWTVVLAFCGLARWVVSPRPAVRISDRLSAHLGADVRVSSTGLSATGINLLGVDVRSEALDLSVEEVKVSRTDGRWEVFAVRPTLRLKDFKEAPSASALRGRVGVTGLRFVLGERELGPFKGELGPDGLDLYCSTPVPIGLKGPPDDLCITLGPTGLKSLLGGSGRFAMTAHRSPEGLSGEGELVIADVEFARWAGLKEFSGKLSVEKGPSLVLEQDGEAKAELAGTVWRLHDVRARWAGGPVEGEAAIDSDRGLVRARFAARFLGRNVTIERARVEGKVMLPAGEGLAVVLEGAAEGWAEFLTAETRAEVHMPDPVSLNLVPKDGAPTRPVSLGGRVGLRLVGTGKRTELSGRVEGLTLGGAAKLKGENPVLSFDLFLSRESLVIRNLTARGQTDWVGRGQARLGFEDAGKLEGTFEFRGFALRELCRNKETAKRVSPDAKIYRAVVANGPLGGLQVKVQSGAWELGFKDEKLGLELKGVEVGIADEAVIDLRK